MARLAGKVAIVTGSALGIGRAICLRFAGEGATVAVTDLLEPEGAALAAEIRDTGGRAKFWALDVTREADVARVVADVTREFGGIDVLVNNAGISGANRPTDELTEADWDRVLAVNVKGTFFPTKHVIAAMRARGGGSIVNLSSIYGLVGAGDVPPYHASKGAVRLMTKNDALIFARDRIRVNSIHPGFIWTPMVQHFLAASGDATAGRHALDALHPLGHLGDADDIAWGAVYLACDESKFVTGTELVIDGGYTAR